MIKPELVLDAKALLGEGPCWDDTYNLLYWVDIAAYNVHIFNPIDRRDKVIHTKQYVGAAIPRSSGGLILAMRHGFYHLDLETEALNFITDPESDKPFNRFNDAKCDASGRLWAGTMGLDESVGKKEGALYSLDKDLNVKKVLGDVGISNGIAWDENSETMYYIDTPTKQITAFDFDMQTGDISNKRVIIEFPEGVGFPDGMNIDSEGMLWIAHWGGSQVSRWNPATGVQIDSISIPALQVTSCVFGGVNLDELYITTARIGMSQDELEQYPHAGGLFMAKPGVKGVKTYQFQG